MPLKPTYEITQGPAAVSFADYANQASRAFYDLLAESPEEPRVQAFLEAHPAFVPGSRSPGGATCASPLFHVLVSQPRLPGLDARQPDFLWFTTTSSTWYPVLIEIEKPSKRLFKKNREPSAEFYQARNQLSQWRTWFGHAFNQLKFQHDYGVPDTWVHCRAMSLHMILVYGRREEFEYDAKLSNQRASLLPGNDEELMSFDRLAPDPLLSAALTVRAVGGGRYRALRVPPTFTHGPFHAERLLFIDGLTEAIEASAGWTPVRQAFVKTRIPYWREWAKLKKKGWISGGRE